MNLVLFNKCTKKLNKNYVWFNLLLFIANKKVLFLLMLFWKKDVEIVI